MEGGAERTGEAAVADGGGALQDPVGVGSWLRILVRFEPCSECNGEVSTRQTSVGPRYACSVSYLNSSATSGGSCKKNTVPNKASFQNKVIKIILESCSVPLVAYVWSTLKL